MTALLVALLTVMPVPAPVRADAGLVRVRLSIGDIRSLSVSVTGSYRIAENGKAFSGGKLTFTGSGSTVTVSHSTLGTLYSGAGVTVERKDLHRDAGKLTFTVSGVMRSYLGHLRVTSSGGKLQAVNHVPLNHYLYGVIAFEMSNAFPVEALKAQAIAAKNFIVPKMSSSGAYDTGDTSSDQVYKGYVASYSNVIEAVDSTINDILLLNGVIMPCWFSASNGGYMLKPSTAWKGSTAYDAGYSEGVDEYDLKNLSTPQETLLLPTLLDKESFANDTFYALVEKACRAATDATVVLPEGAVPGGTVYIRDAVSVHADGSDSVLFGDGDRVKITAALTYTLPGKETEPPAAEPVPAPEETPAEDRATAQAEEQLEEKATTEEAPAEQSAQAPLAVTVVDGVSYAQAPTAGKAGVEAPVSEAAAAPAGEEVTAPVPAADTTGDTGDTSAATEADAFPCETGDCTDAPADEASETVSEQSGEETPVEPVPAEEAVPAEPVIYEVPVTFTLTYAELAGAGLFVRTNLRVYTVSRSDGGFSILHSRYGHGIGLSQRGAQQMAKEGFGYREILAYYYGGATLATLPYITPEEAAKATPVPQSTLVPQSTPVPGETPAAATPAPAPAETSAGTVSGLVSASSVRLRKTASSSGKVLATLGRNTLLTVSGFNGSFYAVRVDATGTAGYIDTDLVTLMGDTVLCKGTLNGDSVNVRSGPSTKYESLTKLDRGASVSVRCMTNGWYRVTVDATGETGYITKRYVTLSAATAEPPAATPSPAPTPAPAPDEAPAATPAPEESANAVRGQINANRVNFRTGPSTSKKSMGRYSKGEALTVYGKTGNWYHVRLLSAKKDGYVYAKYVTLLPEEDTVSASKTAAKGSINTGLLNLRSRPSTGSSSRVLLSLRRGYEVTVHSVSGTWAYVTYNGTSGYCIAKCVKMK